MKQIFLKQKESYFTFCRHAHAFTVTVVQKYATVIMLVVGLTLLSGGMSELTMAQIARDPTGRSGDITTPGYNAFDIRGAVELLFQLIEGAFGALVMVVAGLGAIIAAAFGAYRAAVGMLVVAVGAFILRALVSLFFADFNETDIGSALQNKGQ